MLNVGRSSPGSFKHFAFLLDHSYVQHWSNGRRVGGIEADMIPRSSFSLRDSCDGSLHSEVEASDENWLSSPGPGSATPSSLCIRVTARVYNLLLFPYSPNISNLLSIRKLGSCKYSSRWTRHVFILSLVLSSR